MGRVLEQPPFVCGGSFAEKLVAFGCLFRERGPGGENQSDDGAAGDEGPPHPCAAPFSRSTPAQGLCKLFGRREARCRVIGQATLDDAGQLTLNPRIDATQWNRSVTLPLED